MDELSEKNIKEAERPHLVDWQERGYGSFNNALWVKFREELCVKPVQTCDREDKDISNEYFAKIYEDGNKPVIISGLTDSWIGKKVWSIENFVQRYGQYCWRFSDTHGEMLELQSYYDYMKSTKDDSPLGIYDSLFGDDEPTNELTNEYEAPPCFSYDSFHLYPYSRPPFRWILIGPERSGTGMHIDPLFTNAWVTLMQGKKRWVMFPPSTPPHLVGMIAGEPQLESIKWFFDYYEKTVLCPINERGNEWREEWKPIEILQFPGETVFVPQGWLHVVLNLEESLAVTHNYAPHTGKIMDIWASTIVQEPIFALRWYRNLRIKFPEVAFRIKMFHQSKEGIEAIQKAFGNEKFEGSVLLPDWEDTEEADVSDNDDDSDDGWEKGEREYHNKNNFVMQEIDAFLEEEDEAGDDDN